MALRTILAAARAWLRAGYPADAPKRGYSPLIALMPSQQPDADIIPLTQKGPMPATRPPHP
jgi:hypothetical protein